MKPCGVLVAVGCGKRRWQVDDARVSQKQAGLVEFAEHLAAERGGPRVRVVIFVSDEVSCDQILTRSPRYVCVLSRFHALAYCAPEAWSKILIVDAGARKRAAIALRTGEKLEVLELHRQGLTELEFVAGSLGIQHCLWASGSTSRKLPEALPAVHRLERIRGSQSVVTGALAYANSLMARETGVWAGPKLTTCLRANRLTEYSVHRPPYGVFHSEDPTLEEVVNGRAVFIVADRKVASLYGHAWAAYSARRLNLLGEFTIAATEASKTLQTAERICETASRLSLPRNGIILAIGGGITLDTAGLAASMFRRGVGYVRIPTTLVGLVDVAVGIKQGVNAWGKKNALGSFYAPIAAVNDYRLLATLPEQNIAGGIAEIAKMALIRDPDLFDLIDRNLDVLLSSRFQAPSDLTDDISIRAELLMMEELAPNLFETELRRLVDFGHTFSPTIEARSNYTLSHGAAVAVDIMISAGIAVQRRLADPLFLRQLVGFFDRLGFRVDPRICGTAEMWSGLENICQHRAGKLNLVIVAAPGKPSFVTDLQRTEFDMAVRRLHQETLLRNRSVPHRSIEFVHAAV